MDSKTPSTIFNALFEPWFYERRQIISGLCIKYRVGRLMFWMRSDKLNVVSPPGANVTVIACQQKYFSISKKSHNQVVYAVGFNLIDITWKTPNIGWWKN